MSSRWNANTVLLVVFILILVGAGVDYGRRVLGGTTLPTPPHESGRKMTDPGFKVGDLAPDFALPDANKAVHKLSELVSGKSLLFFACGCNNCKQVQTWMSRMQKGKDTEFPKVITITSAPPESQAAWLRDTRLKQTMLFYTAGVSPDPMVIYQGRPCPRMYLLNADRTVKFIGSSMSEGGGVQKVGMEMAKELGGSLPSTPLGMMKMMGKPPPHQPAEPEGSVDLPPYARTSTMAGPK